MSLTEVAAKLRRYELHEALIQRIHPEINDVIDVDSFLRATVHELGKVIQVDRCDFLSPQPNVTGSPDGLGLRVEHEYRRDTETSSLLKHVFPLSDMADLGLGGTIVIDETSQDVAPTPIRDLCKMAGTTAFLGVPIRFQRELLGILGIHFCGRSHIWSVDEKQLLVSLAQYLVIGLQYTRLYVKMEKEMQIAKALLSIANEIHSKRDFAQITAFILSKAVELLKASHGCLWIPDVTGEILHRTALFPEFLALTKKLGTDTIALSESPLLHQAMLEGRSVDVSDLTKADPLLAGALQGQSAALIPIVIGERTYGVLNLIWLEHHIHLGSYEQELASGTANQIALVIEKNQLSAEVLRLKGELTRSRSTMIVGASAAMEKSIHMALHVAETDTTVLLKGETGTGKELIADLIQKSSGRKDAPYIKINCGAIPETLVEAELFGYEKGAFTDARTQRIGKFESVDGGTVFLDEVGELSLGAQVKLLRVLQQGELYRIGGVQPIQVDVRVITATNIDLELAVREGRFRKDLYYRLNVFPIELPPLRSRPEDIPLLAHHFLDIYKEKSHKPIIGISEEALGLLVRHDWPGNVRELENAIERAVVECTGIVITSDLLPEPITRLREEADELIEPDSALAVEKDRILIQVGASLEQVEQSLIECTLRHTQGDKKQAAKLLGISRKTLYRKLDKYASV